MKTISDIFYKDGLALDLFLPEAPSFPLFIYFHGGGLTGGDKKDAQAFAGDLTAQNIGVASVNYTMYPDAAYPDFLRDAAASVAFLKDRIAAYGECTGLYVGGSSAGGYLSMMLCFCPDFLHEVGMKPSDVSGWVHDSGQPTKHFTVLRNSGMDHRRVIVDDTAPLFWVGAHEEPLSRMLFLVADDDMTNRFEQTVLMLSTLRAFGVDETTARLQILHGKHCAHVFKTDADGKNVFGKIVCDFIRTV